MLPVGSVRQPYSYSVPSPHRLFKNSSTGYICGRNRFLGSLNVYRFGLSLSVNISFEDDVTVILLVFPSLVGLPSGLLMGADRRPPLLREKVVSPLLCLSIYYLCTVFRIHCSIPTSFSQYMKHPYYDVISKYSFAMRLCHFVTIWNGLRSK
jgi:hypothetical protein